VTPEGVSPPNEFLGISVEYAIHPKGVGCFILRFVVHGKGANPKNYKHLTYRESAKFVIPATQTTSGEVIKGFRLNKIAVPVFQPPVRPQEVDKFATKLNVWPLLEEWITETVQAEGFSLIADLKTELRRIVCGIETPEDSIKSVIEFPNLSDPEQQAAALSQVQKPVDEDDDPDKEDPDEDEENEGKDWLN
jgi:hypothetical protein